MYLKVHLQCSFEIMLQIMFFIFPVTLSNLLPDWDQIVATWFTFLTSDDKEYTTLCLKIFLILLDNDTDFPKERRMLLQEHILALVESGFSADVVYVTKTLSMLLF